MEPLKGRGIFADPNELDTAQTRRRVRPSPHVVDVFENGCPRGDANASADQNGNFVVEDVFGRRSIRTVNADRWHGLAILQCDFVHAHGIQGIVFFRLGRAGAEGITESAGEVANLADVDRDVVVKGAGGDGERVPLSGGDVGDVEEEPLAGFVLHARFRELDFQRIVRVANHLGDVRGPARGDFAVDALRQVDTSTPEFPAPPFVADAVVPEGRAGKRGEGFLGVADEAAGCVGVEGKKERDEEVMGVPERLVRLLPYFGMGGGEH